MTDQIADIFAEFLSNPLVSTGITLVGVVVGAVWLAAAWWAYQDAARRTESTLAAFLAAAWIIVSTPLMLPVALAIYGFARPQLTAADHRSRDLARELGAVAVGPACPSCRTPIESIWLRCPACAVWLALPCRTCGVWSARDLETCPYCGSEEPAAPVVEPEAAPELPAIPGMPVGRGVAVGPGGAFGAGLPAGELARAGFAGQGTAAAGVSLAAAAAGRIQRGRVASSARPFSYATSRDASSISS
jgi:hypothetical protein